MKVNISMRILCNALAVAVNQMGDLENYGSVWYHPDNISNILSLCNAQNKFRVMS